MYYNGIPIERIQKGKTMKTKTERPAPTKIVTLKDGSTITLYWSDGLKCYVTIIED